jgi:hypothetical protein
MPPLYLSYGSDLVYRENTVRMAHVLNSVAVHFKSAEQIVILTTSVLACSLTSSSKLRITSYPLVLPLCHSLYISIVSINHICLTYQLCFLKAVNEADWTVWLPDKAPLIARSNSGKVLGLLLGQLYVGRNSLFCLPHQDFHAKIATVTLRCVWEWLWLCWTSLKRSHLSSRFARLAMIRWH